MSNFKINNVKGMYDCIPNDIYIYQYVENILRKLMWNYSFEEIRFPIIENNYLFSKVINNKDDFLFKEMYFLNNRNREILNLRPEGTICCVKTFIKNNLFSKKFLYKLWYLGSMFRYEKPQKGRLREFNQVGVEIFGSKSINLEIELLLFTKRLWKILGLEKFLTLEINTIGSLNDRYKYIDYINKLLIKENKNITNLVNSKNINIFRLLDSKDKKIKMIFSKYPKFIEFVNKKSVFNFNKLCKSLDDLNITYKINTNLVRGLDYYNDFVFEWTNNKFFNSQNSICGGGRYDNLVNNLCNLSIPAAGFAIGIDRLVILLKDCNKSKLNFGFYVDIYIISSYNSRSRWLGNLILEKILNSNLNSLKVYNDYIWCKNLSKKISKVISLKPRILIIIDKCEINYNYITVKDLFFNKQKKIFYKNIILVLNDFLF